MIALIQRTSQATVSINDEIVARIGIGILALLCVQRYDDTARAQRLIERILTYRIFADEQGHMNKSLSEIKGGLLLVPQFTLAANTRQGTRPGFSTCASPELAKPLFEQSVAFAQQRHPQVACGYFGADMAVTLTNSGPVTFWIET